jgi:hypothetical protein
MSRWHHTSIASQREPTVTAVIDEFARPGQVS